MSKSPVERVGAFVEDLLRGRRPRRFVATEDELGAMQAAAGLAAGRVGADLPSKEALDRIHQELARRMDDSAILEPRFNRRVWLRSVGAAAAAVVAGVVIDQVVGGSGVPLGGTASAPVLMPDGGQWRPVAALSDLPDGRPLILFRLIESGLSCCDRIVDTDLGVRESIIRCCESKARIEGAPLGVREG